jgi:hypothetical protein
MARSTLRVVALRRALVLAVLMAGLAAGILAGVSSGAPSPHPNIPCLLASGWQDSTITIPCCGPQRAASDVPCPNPCMTPCPVPTVPSPPPPPAGAPKLTIPKHGFRVRHGRFRVTCRLNGGSGACAVSATNGGRIVGRGHKTLTDGKARVTVKLLVAGRAMLNRAPHRRMRVALRATAGGRSATRNATLRG